MTDLTLLQLLLANLALLAGSCLQGVAGYGIGTLAAPMLFLISPSLVPAPLVLNSVLLVILMLMRNRQSLDFRQVRFTIGGGIVGAILAGITLHFMSPNLFELAFGALILIGVALSVGGLKPQLNARNSTFAGAASTYMGTITAVGGPPLALLYQDQEGPMVRANMSAFFLAASLLSVSALVASGYLGKNELVLMGLTFPGVLLGFLLSGALVERLPVHGLRPFILGIAGLAGFAALIRGITNL